jgi:hypothetical protein
MRIRRFLTIGALAAALLGGAAGLSPAHAASGDAYQIIASPCLWDHQWRVGDYPSSSLPRINCWSYGSSVHVICWFQGQSINGDNYWDRILEDTTNNYGAIMADYYINTGSNNPNNAGIPPCG